MPLSSESTIERATWCGGCGSLYTSACHLYTPVWRGRVYVSATWLVKADIGLRRRTEFPRRRRVYCDQYVLNLGTLCFGLRVVRESIHFRTELFIVDSLDCNVNILAAVILIVSNFDITCMRIKLEQFSSHLKQSDFRLDFVVFKCLHRSIFCVRESDVSI